MRDVRFTPAHATVKVGRTVRWTNGDRVPHDVVATRGATFDSRRLDAGGSFSFRATKAGTITYVCTLHQGMAGTLTIVR